MSHLINFETIQGKQRGILSIYILHSIKKKSKSGYDLINEIKDKTEGSWIPSKGTIYPLLKNLEKEKLIQINKVEERGKNIFQITNEGKRLLKNLKNHKNQMVEKINQFRKLIAEIFDEEVEIINLSFNIRKILMNLTPDRRNELVKSLKKIIDDVEKKHL